MSGKIRFRNSANAPDSATITVNERILKECHNLYADSDNGLIDIAEGLGLSLLAPRKKIIVLLLGNHSAGKSTFINWYVEDQIQKTGVAIETQGFTFVTSGRKRESLTGNATLHLYPHFKPLQKIPGLVDYLNTEISTSKQKKFSLVTFVDTPGLVDGDMKYPFDVNKAILWLGNLADLFFVFFDPMGQALCKRTLTLVEKLNEKHSERMRFFLSKADEAGHESDRQRVMMQIVQELCKRPGLNRTGFDMPTIYIPNQNKQASRCVNQIETVCKEIEKTINQTIQNTLNTLEKDCERISFLIDEKIQLSHSNAADNLRARGRWLLFSAFGIILPLILFINFLATILSRDILQTTLGNTTVDYLDSYLSPIRQFWRGIPVDYHMHVLATMIIISIGLLVLAKVLTRIQPTLNRKQMRELLERKDYIENYVRSKKRTLYAEYLQQSVSEHDLS